MKISFKKLTAQEMVDRGIKEYIYLNPKITFTALLLVFGFSLSLLSSNNPVYVQGIEELWAK